MEVRISIFGSCVSRDPFSFSPDDRFSIGQYVARVSMLGVTGDALDYDPEWYADFPEFEKRCLDTDFRKTTVERITSEPFDYLMLDFIDERFNLLEVDGRLLSKTARHTAGGFTDKYGDRAQELPRLSSETTQRWAEAAKTFFERIKAEGIKEEQIILHEAKWAPHSRGDDGWPIPHSPPYDAMTSDHNDLLEEYFAIIRSLCPGAHVLRVPDRLVVSDPNHKWSKEPFHYRQEYYEAAMDGLREIVGMPPREGVDNLVKTIPQVTLEGITLEAFNAVDTWVPVTIEGADNRVAVFAPEGHATDIKIERVRGSGQCTIYSMGGTLHLRDLSLEADVGKIFVGERSDIRNLSVRIASSGSLVAFGSFCEARGTNIHVADGSSTVEIGDRSILAPGVSIRTGVSIKIVSADGTQMPIASDILIGEDSWIGPSSFLENGAKVGKGTAVLAGSVLNKEVSEKSLVSGNPACVEQRNISWKR